MLFNQFKSLHTHSTPLLLGNVWDASSAKVAEKLGYKAIGTSSAAIAETLGYEDGENMPFSDMLFIVEKITSVTSIPLSVDIESGYSNDPKTTAHYIKALVKLGVVGVNIEDSNVLNGERTLQNAEGFADYLSGIKMRLENDGIDIFINIRTDTFLLALSNAIEETKSRVKLYQAAGADGIFIPCITQKSDIKEVISYTNLPINVMCMPDLPDFKELTKLNVKRISMGNFLHQRLFSHFEDLLTNIKKSDSFSVIF